MPLDDLSQLQPKLSPHIVRSDSQHWLSPHLEMGEALFWYDQQLAAPPADGEADESGLSIGEVLLYSGFMLSSFLVWEDTYGFSVVIALVFCVVLFFQARPDLHFGRPNVYYALTNRALYRVVYDAVERYDLKKIQQIQTKLPTTKRRIHRYQQQLSFLYATQTVVLHGVPKLNAFHEALLHVQSQRQPS